MFKKIDNITIEYDYKKISSKTIVFLHGFGGNLQSFFHYSKSFQNFGYSTLNINLTDYGFKNLPKDFSIYDYADVIAKLIKILKIKSFNIIAHSFGGRISIILSSMYNLKIDRMVLFDIAGIKPKLSFKTKFKVCFYKLLKFLACKKIINKNVLQKFGSSDYKMLNQNLKSVFVNVVNEDLTYLLKLIKTKSLIVFGKSDKDTPIYFAKIFHKQIKNSKLILLNGDHFCYLTQKEKCISLSKKFLEQKENL